MSRIDLRNYIRPELLQILQAESRSEVIDIMSRSIADQWLSDQKEILEEAILHRERLISTAIGLGIAIPHARLSNCSDFFVAIAVAQNGINWGSGDKEPVRLISMIAGPEDRQREYLQLLSQLTLFLRDEHNRKQMLSADSSADIYEIFERSFDHHRAN